ncbi:MULTISPECIES: BLUF domain-containing protein [Vibrio]|uniref:Blue light sensor protein n=1 Tax=Vibrio coralliilyticus TaxID=190893 RepID=A0AAE5ERM6_9VIBR|nr:MULTISPECIES: BLUF domain-containing protein [Vibrio]AIS58386.1 blue light sensor protein [Vibrio coralliilyticus]AIW22965.1 blue light sensor protein [Vibrio coralliilyticus]AXN34654.1 BLUF domain-containing protein [Vibrio coralliilyticus]EEX34562.1 BLUF domain containing protein [Vibrio coralliilyticus ATCC BAA-450]KPH25153.1 blue light sensor protein [Vibrio coralliilyticus]
MIRLLYYSVASSEMTMMDLKGILDVARKNNGRRDVTGMLCYDNEYFLQILEGEPTEVTDLFLTIGRDERHHDVTIMGVQSIEKRAFGQWDMGYAGSSETLQSHMQTLNMDSFDPTALTVKQAAVLLYDLSKAQTAV